MRKICILPHLLLFSCVTVPSTLKQSLANTTQEVKVAKENYTSLVNTAAKGFLDLGQKMGQKAFSAKLDRLLDERDSGSPLAVLKVEVTAILGSGYTDVEKSEMLIASYHKAQVATTTITQQVFSEYQAALNTFKAEVDQFVLSAMSDTSHGNALEYLAAISDYAEALTDYSDSQNKLFDTMKAAIPQSLLDKIKIPGLGVN